MNRELTKSGKISDVKKTAEILFHLKNSLDPKKFAFFDELRMGIGDHGNYAQRLDGWSINYNGRTIPISYEIKVSRSDFLKEMGDPIKRRAGLMVSSEFWFVTPPGLCKPEEIPVECGLMEFDHNGIRKNVVKAPTRAIDTPPWMFLASICRNSDDRGKIYAKYQKHMLKERMTSSILKKNLTERIDFWENYKMGSKEVPNQIAKELSFILAQVNDEMVFLEQQLWQTSQYSKS